MYYHYVLPLCITIMYYYYVLLLSITRINEDDSYDRISLKLLTSDKALIISSFSAIQACAKAVLPPPSWKCKILNEKEKRHININIQIKLYLSIYTI